MMPSVLLIEDTENVRNMYAFSLAHEGFDVVPVGSAGEGLSKLSERTYDVVLLDMMLSGMSGMDLLDNYDIKALSPETKLIVLSNFDSDTIIERAKKFNIDAYLTKAKYEPAQLVAFVKQLLAGTAPEDMTREALPSV